MNPSFEIEHIGIAVHSIKKAFELYETLGWKTIKIEEVPSEKVRVGFISFGNQVHIELLEATSDESPIAKFIAKRGEGLHHLCMRTPDVKKDLKNLSKSGVRLIDDEPKKGAKGCYIAFVHPSSASGVLLELSQEGGHGS